METLRVPARVALLLLCLVAGIGAWLHTDLGFNTYYVDESGYLFAGARLLDGEQWHTRSYVFSSDLPLMLLALAERGFGELGARWLSLGAVYLAAWVLFRALRVVQVSPVPAGVAALLVTLLPSHLLIGQLATYDSLCFLAFAGMCYAGAQMQRASTAADALILGVSVAVCVFTKYIAVAFIPGLVLWLWFFHRSHLFYFLISLGLPLAIYISSDWQGLQMLYQNQLVGSHKANATLTYMLQSMGVHLGALLVGIVVLGLSAGVAKLRGSLSWQTALVGAALVLPMPVYHLLTQDAIAIHKHMIYPATMLILLAVWWFNKLPVRPVLAFGVSSLLVLVLIGQLLDFRERHRYAWPNSQAVQTYLLHHVSPYSQLLSEDPYLLRHVLAERTAVENIYDTTWYDFDLDGFHRPDDVVRALEAGVFDFVYLDDMVTADLNDELRNGVLQQHYELVQEQHHELSGLVTPSRVATQSLYRRRADAS